MKKSVIPPSTRYFACYILLYLKKLEEMHPILFEREIIEMRIMMFLLLGMAFVDIHTSVVFAAKNSDTGPGCGLGTLAWADYKHPKNIAPQVMMATTNGTLFNTVGISFGLSGCTNDGTVMAEHKTEMFVASTFESLSQDMARGQGEHLASLATMTGVSIEHQPAFFLWHKIGIEP